MTLSRIDVFLLAQSMLNKISIYLITDNPELLAVAVTVIELVMAIAWRQSVARYGTGDTLTVHTQRHTTAPPPDAGAVFWGDQ